MRARAVEMHMDMSQEPSHARIYKENAAPHTEAKLARQTLCERAQSKRTWTCDQNHFMRKIKRKMPLPRVSTSIKHRPFTPTISVDTLFGEKTHFFKDGVIGARTSMLTCTGA